MRGLTEVARGRVWVLVLELAVGIRVPQNLVEDTFELRVNTRDAVNCKIVLSAEAGFREA